MDKQNLSSSIILEDSESFKLAQALYHAVTDKTESMTKFYSENYKITRDDIKQLYTKFERISSQWKIISKSENITIQHLVDNKSCFSSFDRFMAYDTSQTSPVESIMFEYNVLLKLPNTEKPQPYRIMVHMSSGIALKGNNQTDEKSTVPNLILKLLQGRPIIAKVEYVDYMVAINFISTLDSWVNEIKIASTSRFIDFLQKKSHWLPRLSEGSILIVTSLWVCSYTNETFAEGNSDQVLAKFLIISLMFIMLSGKVALWFGSLGEKYIDQISSLSYIQLNKGDERLLTERGKSNFWSIVIAISTFTISIIQGVISGYIVKLLMSNLGNL
ncbi:MAG: hypothetical protein F6J96_28545 [Symploca sp. SIO1C2]|nr:hypothetical protein [Symploca sp. SIO1C2]